MWRGLASCVCAALLLLLPRVSSAADPNEFLARIHTEAGTGYHLPYRLFVPMDYDPAKEYPLVLFLHGLGECGTNNVSQVNVNLDNLFARVKTPAYSSFLLAPQTTRSWGWTPDRAIRMMLDLIDELEMEFNVDGTRLYITGLSLGGAGTWGTISEHPGLFAAAVPICGWGDTSKAPLLVNQPIWAFHAADDGVVSVAGSRDMIAAIEAAGGSPLYTEYPTGGHMIWSRAYDEPELYEWMFAQAVPEPCAMALSASGVASLLFMAGQRRNRSRQRFEKKEE